MLFSLPVPLSLAVTFRMPLASMLKVHLDLRHAARRRRNVSQLELAKRLVAVHNGAFALEHVDFHLRLVVGRGAEGSDFDVGIVVLRSMSLVITPPIVSMPRLRGVTSRSSTSLTSPCSTPPWMAAPTATTSSGFTPFIGSLPKIFLTFSCTAGMRVIPPTKTTASMSLAVSLASLSAFSLGPAVASMSSATGFPAWRG